MRVYAPGLDLNDLEQAQRHRYFTAGQIEALAAAEVEDQISRSLTRRVGRDRRNDPLLIASESSFAEPYLPRRVMKSRIAGTSSVLLVTCTRCVAAG